MKLIHTADCHLDSKLSRHFDEAKAAERKNELLSTFQNIVHYAVSNDVEAILIAGDLFDVRTIAGIMTRVLSCRISVTAFMRTCPEISNCSKRAGHPIRLFPKTEPKSSLPVRK